MTAGWRRAALALATITCLSLLASSARATDYYVDSVAGVDTNNGTAISTPWKTLTKVNGITFLAGDKVLFKRGSAWTGTLTPKGSGTAGNPLVFDAYGLGAAPIINGAGAANAVMLWSKNHFTFQNFNVTNNAAAEGYRAGIRLTFIGAAAPSGVTTYRGVKILNNEVHHVAGYTSRPDFYNTAAIYVEFSDYQGGQTYVDDLLIEGNDIHDNRAIGLHVKAPTNYAGRQDLWATNLVVRANLFDQGGADHIVINGANGPLMEYNAGYDAGLIGANYVHIAGMWTCYFTREAVFQFNEVARTRNEYANGVSGDSQAFDVDYGTYDTHTFQYNYTHDNAGGVLIIMPKEKNIGAVDLVKTVVYRYNLSVNDARNTNSGCQFAIFPVFGVSSAHIYNNVFYSTRQEGFKFTNVQAAYYTNNVFHMPSAIYPSKPTFKNNAYYAHNADVTDPYKVVANPLFVGPLPGATGADGFLLANTAPFKLQSTSPLINAGVTIASNGGVDFWGNPLYAGAAADIGAHEVPGGNVPLPSPMTITDNPPSATVTYTGANWAHAADTLYHNSTRSDSSIVGQYMQHTFTGTNVTLVGKRTPGGGKINVSIDGGPPVLVDCYWPIELWRSELFQVSGLTNAAHTIRATIATKNPASTFNYIGIDYFRVAPGTPPSTPVINRVDGAPSASVVYTGTWTHVTAESGRYALTRSHSPNVGAYVNFAFTGTGVRVYTRKGSDQGKLSIAIDGGAPTVVSCYQPTIVDDLVRVYEINGLTAGAHTVRATVATKDAASSSNSVSIDFFEALTGGYAPPAPVIVDNPPGAAVAYAGTWTHAADVNYYASTKSLSNVIGNYVTFTFTGTGASLHTMTGPDRGKLSVQIDGGAATLVDTYSPSVAYQVKVFEVTGLAPGTHTLKATVDWKNSLSTGNWIGLDYFKYQP
jgi:hypothetical protein